MLRYCRWMDIGAKLVTFEFSQSIGFGVSHCDLGLFAVALRSGAGVVVTRDQG